MYSINWVAFYCRMFSWHCLILAGRLFADIDEKDKALRFVFSQDHVVKLEYLFKDVLSW